MNKDQVKGRVEEVTGNVKEVAGKVIGNNRLKSRGRSTELPAKYVRPTGM